MFHYGFSYCISGIKIKLFEFKETMYVITIGKPNAMGYLILNQLGTEEIVIGISTTDSEAFLCVSVPARFVHSVPSFVRISTESEDFEIPIKVKGDYEPIQLH